MAGCKLDIPALLEILRKPLSPEARQEFLFYLGSKLANSRRRLRVGELGEIAQQVYLQKIVSTFLILFCPG